MERRYTELYKQLERREAEGRVSYRVGSWLAGSAFWLLTFLSVSALLSDKGDSAGATFIGALVGLIPGLFAFGVLWHYGHKQVMEAQKTLVIVDTENNTRQLVLIVSKMAEDLSAAKPAAAARAE